MLKIIPAAIFACFLLCFDLHAQDIVQTRQYPKTFFQYPLDLPPSTAGSFGELRPNHFHSGLDFKTNSRTGYPVHAAFDGYISRLRIQFGGFGRAVYITHPNGFTTVYGHLESLSPEIAKLVRDYQYQQHSYEVDFSLMPFQMPVYKGQVFALSGNAGASAGPHLHFEIRDSQTQETINPQLFGLTIPDKVAPFIGTACIYQINGHPFSENTPREFLPVAGSNGNYHLLHPHILNLSGEIGFGITANDMNSTSFNRNGIYSIELKLDGKNVYTFAVERFAFDQTHAINAYIDYPVFLTSARWIQKCFIPPGSKISLYPQSVNHGLINFNDDALHEVEYVVRDVAGNTSTLTLKIKSSIPKDHPVNTVKGTLFRFNQKNVFSNDKVRLIIDTGNLYDDLDFNYAVLPKRPGTYSAVYRLHNRFTPVNDSCELWIKPDSTIKKYADKAVIVSTTGICEGGVYDNGYVKTHIHTFGDFYVSIDNEPPTIHALNMKNGGNMSRAKGLFFRMSDNLSGIKSYNGKIDDKWVLMEWDYKSKILSYTFDGDITPGKHTFELTVADKKDNTSVFSAEFYR